MCGGGKFMHRWGEWESPNCPRCGLLEDAPHVWRCKGSGTKEIWIKAVSDLESLMRQLGTDPTLVHIIVIYLKGWWDGSDITYAAPREFQELLKAQSRLGWGRFFEGWFVKQWAVYQQRYYELIKASRTGRRWVSAIIQKLWNTAWDMWEHCNGVLHDKENLVTRFMVIQLNNRVSRVYNDLSSRVLRHSDRHLVHLSLYKLLRRDNNYKVTWLSVAEPALRQGRQN